MTEMATSVTRDDAPKRVFSYVVAHDNGFSPNPFHGLLSLACCKPKIRQSARPGDIIVGMSRRCERVVYAMQVGQVIGFDEYWSDPRYLARRPAWGSPNLVERNGDNIYEPMDGDFRQVLSWHSEPDGSENAHHKLRDLGAAQDNSVLISEAYSYWGGSGPVMPAELGFLRVGRAHRCRFTPEQVAEVAKWFAHAPRGLVGAPTNWKNGDESWQDA